MKNQSRLYVLLAGLSLLAVSALRADEPTDKPAHKREHTPAAVSERVSKELGLSAEQDAKWKAIGEQEKAAMQALRDDTSIAKEDKRAKALEINKGFADQRRAILNPDQTKQFNDMRAKMRERGERRAKGEKKGGK